MKDANDPTLRGPERTSHIKTEVRPFKGRAGRPARTARRPTGPLGDAARQERNRRDHRELLIRGHAQGILVYEAGRAVGWCQFGRRENLPRIERGRKYRSVADELGDPPRWRVTCFFVDRPFRRQGVARRALRAALDAIERQGGGVEEAYPATHGRAVATWFGSQRMFVREGFRVVRPFGASNVLVRRTLRGRRNGAGTDRSPARRRREYRGETL